MANPEGHQPSPSEVRMAETSMDERQKEQTEKREDEQFEARKLLREIYPPDLEPLASNLEFISGSTNDGDLKKIDRNFSFHFKGAKQQSDEITAYLEAVESSLKILGISVGKDN
jgi:hypothetical protein